MPLLRISAMPSESAANVPRKSRLVRLRIERNSDGKVQLRLWRWTLRREPLFCARNSYTCAGLPAFADRENWLMCLNLGNFSSPVPSEGLRSLG